MGANAATLAAPPVAVSPEPSTPDAELLRALTARIDPQDPGAFNNLGVLYFSKGMYADAVDAFISALNLDGRMRTAARNLEVAAGKDGACDARIAALDARLALDADDVAARRDRARLLRLIGRLPESARELDALIAENPDDAAALFERGQIEVRSGDLRRAQRWFERAVNANDDDPVSRLHLAEVLYQRGQNEQALGTLDALVARDDSIADAHLLRGFVLGDMGHQELARAATERANALNPSFQVLEPHLSLESGTVVPTGVSAHQPDSALPRYGLGLAFRQRGYFAQARQEFLRSIDSGEEDRMARHALAELGILEGKFTEARLAYEALLTAQPEQPRYWNEYGVALHQEGRLAQAADAYRSALRHDPRYALAYNNLGVALSDLGDDTAAREALVRSMELNPSQVAAPLNLAHWYASQRDYLAALTLSREVVDFHGDDARGWYAMGLMLAQLKRVPAARDAFASAIERQPGHAEARYELARVLNTLGDAEGALRETEYALGLCPVRMAARMSIGIDVQDECPDACGSINLLSLNAVKPLSGVTIGAHDVAGLLPETADAEPRTEPSATVDAGASCDAADRFAARGVHGEAVDRYAAARILLEPGHSTPDAPDYALWRRAALGEARSQCLLGHSADAKPMLKVLGSHNKHDVEVLVLFARAAADASVRPADEHVDAARKALLRTLRLEPTSAALMHFAGDVSRDIRDDGLALACYRRALALDPSRPSPRVAIARLLRARGDFLAARLELVAALTAAPGWRDAVLELANVHCDADRPHDALAMVSRYLGNNASDLEALVLLAEVLIRLDLDTDARVAITRVLRFDAHHPMALWLDGVLLSRQFRMRDALDRWRRVAAQTHDADSAERAKQAIAENDAQSMRMVS